ncbi:MAG TPA: hypothetical protein VHM90_21440 [Phycisphaerae bacterium]|jgi:Arc/MetJ-type ribon-helix-helix transcriptional regulator|nr:hypothetical protein [Phycisphaerae bacterium]
MTIIIGPETQRMLEEKLKTGDYKSTEEVLQAALHALDQGQEEELDDETRAAIARAEQDIAQGRVHDWNVVRDQVLATLSGKKANG